jgi:hypothetical protein
MPDQGRQNGRINYSPGGPLDCRLL